jgi:hypothetical protein
VPWERRECPRFGHAGTAGRAGPQIGGQGEIHRKFIRLGQCMETRMAIVVALADRRPRAPRPQDKEPREAKILWFTGVRYERLADSPRHGPAPAPRASKK